jgi:hypothetical protein
MTDWSLSKLLANLHNDISGRLSIARESFAHPGTKGDASEVVWLELLQTYLPKRYQADRGHIVDSEGHFSDQIDVVVYDRQYSPFIFTFQDQSIIPAESVYAVFEAKQTITAPHVEYAQGKAESVRKLHRTSLPIPYAGGIYSAKKPGHIIAGLLTFESEWSPPLGDALRDALSKGAGDRTLDLGCVAAHGLFACGEDACHTTENSDKAATAFLLELIARLQALATVPMIDVRAYARWLTGP